MTRSRRRLVRRRYCNLGPNFCIHVHGYDKLKLFGISVHGASDGISRKIIWLTASHTNKNPRHVALNFVEFLRQSKRVPRLVRSDAGTKNVIIRSIQKLYDLFTMTTYKDTEVFLRVDQLGIKGLRCSGVFYVLTLPRSGETWAQVKN